MTFIAYVASGGRCVVTVRVDPASGALIKVGELVFRTSQAPQGRREISLSAMATTPDLRHLFVADRTAPYAIHTFTIDERDGSLRQVGTTPTQDSANFLSTDRTGAYLFATHNPPEHDGYGFISVARIGDKGVVRPPHQVIRTPPKPHSVLPDPTNRFVLVPVCDDDTVYRYRLDVDSGVLDDRDLEPLQLRPGSGPRHHRYHPNGRFLYINCEYDGAIYVYRYDTVLGAATELQVVETIPRGVLDDARVSDLCVSPDGDWLFCGIRSSSRIMTFRIDAVTGLLTHSGLTEVASNPRGFAVGPSGNILLHSAHRSDKLVAYRVERGTGALEQMGEIAVAAPNYVEAIDTESAPPA